MYCCEHINLCALNVKMLTPIESACENESEQTVMFLQPVTTNLSQNHHSVASRIAPFIRPKYLRSPVIWPTTSQKERRSHCRWPACGIRFPPSGSISSGGICVTLGRQSLRKWPQFLAAEPNLNTMHFQGIDHHSLLQHSTFLGTCRWVIRGNQTHVGVSINGGTPFTMVVYIGKSYSNDLELMILRKHQHFRNTWNGRFPTSREPISLSLWLYPFNMSQIYLLGDGNFVQIWTNTFIDKFIHLFPSMFESSGVHIPSECHPV